MKDGFNSDDRTLMWFIWLLCMITMLFSICSCSRSRKQLDVTVGEQRQPITVYAMSQSFEVTDDMILIIRQTERGGEIFLGPLKFGLLNLAYEDFERVLLEGCEDCEQ